MRRTLAAGLILTACSAALLQAAPATAAVAPRLVTNDTFNRPASGVFTLTGHGWGHGHGMSQWGAEGAAYLGVPASTIVSTYYPGTTATVVPNTPIRVKLSATNSYDLAVLPSAGLTVTDGANRKLVLTAPATMWRVIADGAGQHLQRQVTGKWSAVAVAGATTLANPVRFSNTA